MKMMHGAWDLPCSKRSRTRLAPTPTNISTKSEPDIEKNGRPASPATALASSVLPVPGGPDQQRALGKAAAEPGEFLRVLQELDDLLQLDLGLVGAGHVGEGDLGRVAGEQFRLRLPERERAAAAGLELAQQEEPEPEDDDPGQRRDDDRGDAALGLLGQDRHAGVLEALDEHLAVGHRQENLETLCGPVVLGHGILEVALEALAVEHLDALHVALLELAAELGVGEFLRRVALLAHHLEERQRHQAHEEPEGQVLAQVTPVGAWGPGRESVSPSPLIPGPR